MVGGVEQSWGGLAYSKSKQLHGGYIVHYSAMASCWSNQTFEDPNQDFRFSIKFARFDETSPWWALWNFAIFFLGLPGKENQFYKAENVECRNGALIITAQRERAKAESKCEALQRYLSPSERVDSKNPGQMKRNVFPKTIQKRGTAFDFCPNPLRTLKLFKEFRLVIFANG